MVGGNENKELLSIIYETNDLKLLDELSFHNSMIIRRAISRNINSTKSIINRLAKDPVQNVSYIASQHPNCTIIRKFSEPNHICVSCIKDERTLDCNNCNIKD